MCWAAFFVQERPGRVSINDMMWTTFRDLDFIAEAYAVICPNATFDNYQQPEHRQFMRERVRNVTIQLPDHWAAVKTYLPAFYWDAPSMKRVQSRLPTNLQGVVANVACDMRLIVGYPRRR
jgi:hypothetical protein